MADGGVTIHLPGPEPTGSIKDQVYRYRGETVSVGGAVEWIIHRLADQFAGSAQRDAGRNWDVVKAYVRQRGLTGSLQPQLQAVAEYFKARNPAAHAATLVVQVGESTQIFRLYGKSTQRITIEELRREVADARAGYAGAQAIGRALDDDQPTVLAELDPLAKAMLIGRI